MESHLLHPHAWVRLASSRLLGLLFAAWKPDELVTSYQKGATSIDFLSEDLPAKVWFLFFIFISPHSVAINYVLRRTGKSEHGKTRKEKKCEPVVRRGVDAQRVLTLLEQKPIEKQFLNDSMQERMI